jgi:methionyl-tRNA formyltransferase
MNKKNKVYFLGSGKIAVPILEQLLKAKSIELVGVGTQLDRPSGRHKKLHPTPIGEFTARQGIKVDKISSVNSPDFIEYIGALLPDFILVVSFGQILKKTLLNLPQIACVNIHASLLPRYRGASPIAAAITHREQCTGICFMRMDAGLDTGDIYCSYEHHLDGHEYADLLEESLGLLAAAKVEVVLNGIAADALRPFPQNHGHATITKKIHKNEGHLDWSLPAIDIEAKVRGYFPWPGVSFSMIAHQREISLRITSAVVKVGMYGQPGEVLQADKRGWIVACGQDALEIHTVVPQGKKEMRGAEFLNGCHLVVGDLLPSAWIEIEKK